jgi:antitoxin VapB
VQELLAIADRAAAHVKRPYSDHADLLYDENGLPK